MTLIDAFTNGSYQVIRKTTGIYDKGFYVPGPTTCLEISGSLQPLSARDLKMVEEGYRLKQLWNLYTNDPLIVQNSELGTSDTVYVDGESYRVISVEAWTRFNLPYFKNTIVREPEQ